MYIRIVIYTHIYIHLYMYKFTHVYICIHVSKYPHISHSSRIMRWIYWYIYIYTYICMFLICIQTHSDLTFGYFEPTQSVTWLLPGGEGGGVKKGGAGAMADMAGGGVGCCYQQHGQTYVVLVQSVCVCVCVQSVCECVYVYVCVRLYGYICIYLLLYA